MSELLEDTTYDVIVLGTSLVPCMVGAACSRIGQRVLHLDRGMDYGGNTRSITLADADAWAAARTRGFRVADSSVASAFRSES